MSSRNREAQRCQMEPSRRVSAASQSFFKVGDIYEKYEIGKELGVGNYAKVYLGTNKETKEQVAIKVLPLRKDTLRDALNEIDILARVGDHPHVIKLKEIFENGLSLFIVMELVTGGDLFDRICAKKRFTETDARDLMFVLLETIRHMHSYGIAHRDLKPENILLASPAPDAPIKLADFGLAKLYINDQLTTLCGSPAYVAPEVLRCRDGYTPQCDMWSIGVILYIVLCGYSPFQNENQTKLFKQILKGSFHFHSPYWDNVSDEAKDMITKLLMVDPLKRLTPEQALAHPFMTAAPTSSVNLAALNDYVLRMNKRKFRTLKNALAVARALTSSTTTGSQDSHDVTQDTKLLGLQRVVDQEDDGALNLKSFRDNSADWDDEIDPKDIVSAHAVA